MYVCIYMCMCIHVYTCIYKGYPPELGEVQVDPIYICKCTYIERGGGGGNLYARAPRLKSFAVKRLCCEEARAQAVQSTQADPRILKSSFCIYIHPYIYCVSICIYVYMYINMNICNVYMYIYMNIHIYIYVYVYVCVCVCVCMYIHRLLARARQCAG